MSKRVEQWETHNSGEWAKGQSSEIPFAFPITVITQPVTRPSCWELPLGTPYLSHYLNQFFPIVHTRHLGLPLTAWSPTTFLSPALLVFTLSKHPATPSMLSDNCHAITGRSQYHSTRFAYPSSSQRPDRINSTVPHFRARVSVYFLSSTPVNTALFVKYTQKVSYFSLLLKAPLEPSL